MIKNEIYFPYSFNMYDHLNDGEKVRLSQWEFTSNEVSQLLIKATSHTNGISLGQISFLIGLAKETLGIEYHVASNDDQFFLLLQAIANSLSNTKENLLSEVSNNVLVAMRSIFIISKYTNEDNILLRKYYLSVKNSISIENFDVLLLWQLLHGNTNQYCKIYDQISYKLNKSCQNKNKQAALLHLKKLEIISGLASKNKILFNSAVIEYVNLYTTIFKKNLKHTQRRYLFDFYLSSMLSFSKVIGLERSEFGQQKKSLSAEPIL